MKRIIGRPLYMNTATQSASAHEFNSASTSAHVFEARAKLAKRAIITDLKCARANRSSNKRTPNVRARDERGKNEVVLSWGWGWKMPHHKVGIVKRWRDKLVESICREHYLCVYARSKHKCTSANATPMQRVGGCYVSYTCGMIKSFRQDAQICAYYRCILSIYS